MPEHYGEKSAEEPKKSRTNGKKLTDTQKKQLAKHMEKHKKEGMSANEIKSHRMKMMVRMRKGMSITKAHNDIMKG